MLDKLKKEHAELWNEVCSKFSYLSSGAHIEIFKLVLKHSYKKD